MVIKCWLAALQQILCVYPVKHNSVARVLWIYCVSCFMEMQQNSCEDWHRKREWICTLLNDSPLRYTGLHFISNGRIGLSEQYNHICMMLIYFACALWLPWDSSSFLNTILKKKKKSILRDCLKLLFKKLVLNKEKHLRHMTY